MSLFKRFFEFISYPSHSRTMGFLAFLVVLLAIPLTVNIAQKQQELRQHAAEISSGGGSCDTSNPCTGWTYTTCRTKDFELGYHPICGSYNNPDECYPGTAPDTSHCQAQSGTTVTQLPSTSTQTGTSTAPGTGGTSNLRCLDPNGSINSNCHFLGGTNLGNSECPAGTQIYDCTGTSLTPTTTQCERDNGQCIDQATYVSYQQQGKTGTIVSESCWSGDQVCFMPGTTGGTSTSPDCAAPNECVQELTTGWVGVDGFKCPGALICAKYTPPAGGGTASCDVNNQNDGWSYQCGIVAGCAVGEHKATCTKTGIQDSRCFSDNLFVGTNPCAGAPAAPPGGRPPANQPAAPTNCPASTTCHVAQANTCTNQGVQDTYSGANCTLNKDQPCTLPSVSNTCNPGSVCPAGGTGTCVASAATPGLGLSAIDFTIGLDGIGQTGDRAAPAKAPGTRSSRDHNFFYQIFDNAGTTVLTEGSSRMSFDASSGKFKGEAALTVTLPNGTYIAKVRPVGFLSKIVRNIQVSGLKSTAPSVDVINGDINADNHVTVDDYTLLKSCMFKAATGNCLAADLDDSGTVDIFDYNLWLREFSAGAHDGE